MRRPSPSLSVIGAAFAVVGLALLLLEVLRALSGQSLGGLSVGLLWAGVGLLVAGMVTVSLSLFAEDGPAGS